MTTSAEQAAAIPATGAPCARLLLVDDDAAVRVVTSRILEAHGYGVTTAANGRAAAELITAGGFEVIVSDISMPELNGIELLRMIRERDLDVPVVLVTGSPDLETAMQAIAHGALQYLVKPVRSADLLDVVRRGVSLHQLSRMKQEALRLVSDGGLAVPASPPPRTASLARSIHCQWFSSPSSRPSTARCSATKR